MTDYAAIIARLQQALAIIDDCAGQLSSEALEHRSDRGHPIVNALDWHLTWRGQVCVVRSVDEALDALERGGG